MTRSAHCGICSHAAFRPGGSSRLASRLFCASIVPGLLLATKALHHALTFAIYRFAPPSVSAPLDAASCSVGTSLPPWCRPATSPLCCPHRATRPIWTIPSKITGPPDSGFPVWAWSCVQRFYSSAYTPMPLYRGPLDSMTVCPPRQRLNNFLKANPLVVSLVLAWVSHFFVLESSLVSLWPLVSCAYSVPVADTISGFLRGHSALDNL